MFICAQIFPSGLCHTIGRLSEEVIAPNIIPLTEPVPNVTGKKYNGSTFIGLESTVDKPVLAVNEVATITVSWRNLDGDVVPEAEAVTATCSGIANPVSMSNGTGSITFTSDTAGTYIMEIHGACGCRTVAEITVNG